ncbi:hypothetical protein DL764_010781 [Monosporascus ibericus]|uniref:Uncharacterized protein n=1 Tax=Monosporascus ibericus TaxID=155417 RepID=A0A4Q4SUI0_9PEZI|nr:hypothetical protein DL764_010781 [Monosporascus ibericus]
MIFRMNDVFKTWSLVWVNFLVSGYIGLYGNHDLHYDLWLLTLFCTYFLLIKAYVGSAILAISLLRLQNDRNSETKLWAYTVLLAITFPHLLAKFARITGISSFLSRLSVTVRIYSLYLIYITYFFLADISNSVCFSSSNLITLIRRLSARRLLAIAVCLDPSLNKPKLKTKSTFDVSSLVMTMDVVPRLPPVKAIATQTELLEEEPNTQIQTTFSPELKAIPKILRVIQQRKAAVEWKSPRLNGSRRMTRCWEQPKEQEQREQEQREKEGLEKERLERSSERRSSERKIAWRRGCRERNVGRRRPEPEPAAAEPEPESESAPYARIFPVEPAVDEDEPAQPSPKPPTIPIGERRVLKPRSRKAKKTQQQQHEQQRQERPEQLGKEEALSLLSLSQKKPQQQQQQEQQEDKELEKDAVMVKVAPPQEQRPQEEQEKLTLALMEDEPTASQEPEKSSTTGRSRRSPRRWMRKLYPSPPRLLTPPQQLLSAAMDVDQPQESRFSDIKNINTSFLLPSPKKKAPSALIPPPQKAGQPAAAAQLTPKLKPKPPKKEPPTEEERKKADVMRRRKAQASSSFLQKKKPTPKKG